MMDAKTPIEAGAALALANANSPMLEMFRQWYGLTQDYLRVESSPLRGHEFGCFHRYPPLSQPREI